MITYTVILAYPNLDGNDHVETYIGVANAALPEEAAEAVQAEACEANDSWIAPEEFQVLYVFVGDIEPHRNSNDFA